MNEISVITTCFNDSVNIKDYLNDICFQSIQPYEIIIVDGGSKDNTVSVVESYKQTSKVPIRIIQDGRLNIAQGFNYGIRNARTQLVCLTCIGNKFPKDTLEILYNSFIKSKCDACYGKMKGVNSGNFSVIYNRCFVGGRNGIPIMSNRCVLYDKSVFDKVGLFLENFLYAGEDAEFLQSFKKMNLIANYVPHIVVYWKTPNSYKEYFKQLKFYSIAELQYAPLLNQFFNKDLFFCLVLLFAIIASLWNSSFIAIILLLFIIQVLCVILRIKSLDLKIILLYSSRRFIKLFYKIKYIKYCFPKNRVKRC